jgi:cell wall-associated NlpC family hydrolase
MTKLGCDCTGMIIGICRSLGYLGAYKLREYPPDWNMHSGRGNYIEEELNKVANEIPIKEMEEGDILIFYLFTCLAHVGILVNKDNGMFVHTLVTSKKCEYAIYKNSSWSSRFKKVYRLDPVKMERFHG